MSMSVQKFASMVHGQMNACFNITSEVPLNLMQRYVCLDPSRFPKILEIYGKILGNHPPFEAECNAVNTEVETVFGCPSKEGCATWLFLAPNPRRLEMRLVDEENTLYQWICEPGSIERPEELYHCQGNWVPERARVGFKVHENPQNPFAAISHYHLIEKASGECEETYDPEPEFFNLQYWPLIRHDCKANLRLADAFLAHRNRNFQIFKGTLEDLEEEQGISASPFSTPTPSQPQHPSGPSSSQTSSGEPVSWGTIALGGTTLIGLVYLAIRRMRKKESTESEEKPISQKPPIRS